MSMSSPSKSPTMEPEQSHPHHKASVTTQVASYSPKKESPHAQAAAQLITPNETGNSLTTNVSASAELSDDETNSFNNNLKKEEDEFFDSFPPGYRFNPFDEELVVHYLKRKVFDQPLPPNRIIEVNLYRHNPEVLAEKYQKFGEKEWYFFTPRDRKYKNGSRPRRAAGDGYWKATGADKQVKSNGALVGYRKALVFYKGKPPRGDKTNWIMHEFRVKDSPVRSKRGENDMRLDNWVLCRIYKKADKNSKRCESRNHVEYPAVEIHSPSPQPHIINGDQSMEIEMTTIVDPLLEYDNKYSQKAYGMPNVCGVFPNNVVQNNRIQAVQTVTMNAGTAYASLGQPQSIGVRPPSMPLPESLLGSRYVDESTILQDDMMFDTKGFGNCLYSNYSGQFLSLDHVFPYTD